MANYQAPQQLQIRSTADITTSDGIKVMVYGLAGSGKTRLIATAPNPIIISAERGLLSLRHQNLPYILINSIEDLRTARMQLMNDRRFDTVALDSASEIAETCLNAMLAGNKDGRRAYGDMAQAMLNEVRAFRDFPQRHIVFTMKQGRIKDEQTGGFLNGPLMPGQQLDQHMPYMFDEMFQLVTIRNQDGSIQSALRTQRDNQNEAKDRSGALDIWEPPNLTHIFRKIAGN